MREENCGRDWSASSDQLGRQEGTFHERSVTRDMSRKIRSPAMREVKAGTKGGLMMTFLIVAVLAILGFLCFTGPDGLIGPRPRHCIEFATAVFRLRPPPRPPPSSSF